MVAPLVPLYLIMILVFVHYDVVFLLGTGLTESLFLPHKDVYIEYEQASLRQLYKAKMEELRAEGQQSSESSGTIGRSKGAAMASSHQQISVTVVTEFVRWNEEAISRCTLFSSQPAAIAANVRAVFTCLLDQVSIYITEGLERARDSLTEAAALRERFVLPSVSRRVAAAAASAAEAAAAAGESSFRSFMVSVQRCGSSVAIVQQYFANSISRLLLPVDGAHASSCEEMATAMSSAEGAAYKGLQQCIETVMAEVERVLSTEQKVADYRSPDDSIVPDHRPTQACSKVVAYLSRVLESAFTALEGLNKQAFLTELGNRLHKGLLNHWQKFTFNARMMDKAVMRGFIKGFDAAVGGAGILSVSHLLFADDSLDFRWDMADGIKKFIW
ncbi:Exocyst complex component 5 [Capsicum baccatum]|uniref:Exocyst complex component 5 n=1 Tax=Capsicum baccatum TaxID=33114 RepID=A0A2G2XCQ5_CAPBA|nr:Exocyst complex component 5 [Capsicum baccatum]